MIRIMDFFFSLLGIIALSPIYCLTFSICLFESNSPIFVQERMGRHMKPFILLKFRTMNKMVPNVPTHNLDHSSITFFGRFLRVSKIDELPQLFNVLIGDMSLVGPRPNLFSQTELIRERKARGVYNVRPGITGLAQIQKIDMSYPGLLASTDAKMIFESSIRNYFKILISTFIGKGFGDRVSKKKLE
jgi:lipopolysaccharide/colanic/teichoic acid biosynthesis glycosyltransferase